MSSAYNCERAYRSILVLATDPSELRSRLATAWGAGLSQIAYEEIPEDCTVARKSIQRLKGEFSQKSCRIFGDARASLRGRHQPALVKMAEEMLNIQADFDRHFEMKLQEAKQ